MLSSDNFEVQLVISFHIRMQLKCMMRMRKKPNNDRNEKPRNFYILIIKKTKEKKTERVVISINTLVSTASVHDYIFNTIFVEFH